MFRKVLTSSAVCGFILIDAQRDNRQSPWQACRHPPLHYRDPARLLASTLHSPSLRLRRLRPRQRPSRLGFDRQLSRRAHQADQPLRRTEAPGPTMVAQLPQTQGHLGARLRTQPQTAPPGESSLTLDPLMSRALAPQLTFADLEFIRLGVFLDPVLQRIDSFLNKNFALVEQVRLDLERGLKKPGAGRNGMTAPQTLRSLILMRVKNWDYRDLRDRINDGYTLRGFTQFNGHSVPKHDAFNRAFNRLTPATLRAINQDVVQAAVQLGLEDGKKLRVDTTVVETNIHYPTDATLLWNSVRTINRLVADDLHDQVPEGVKFTNRTRSARRRMQLIQRMTSQQRQQQVPKYRELMKITGQGVQNARQVVEQTKDTSGVDLVAGLVIDALRKEITFYCDLADKVIDQTRRRVIHGEEVPSGEKVYSIFEPHRSEERRVGKEGSSR